MKIGNMMSLSRKMLNEHGLHDWDLRTSSTLNTLGDCDRNSDKKLIRISRAYTENNNWSQISLTVLHEIAHALTPGQGHNRVWADKLREIGGDPNREDYNVTMPKRHRIWCMSCESVLGDMATRRMNLSRRYCNRCGPTTESNLRWARKGE